MKSMVLRARLLAVVLCGLVLLPGCCATCLIGPILALLGLVWVPNPN